MSYLFGSLDYLSRLRISAGVQIDLFSTQIPCYFVPYCPLFDGSQVSSPLIKGCFCYHIAHKSVLVFRASDMLLFFPRVVFHRPRLVWPPSNSPPSPASGNPSHRFPFADRVLCRPSPLPQFVAVPFLCRFLLPLPPPPGPDHRVGRRFGGLPVPAHHFTSSPF